MKNLIYLFPLIMDIVVGGILFIAAYRFSEAKVAGWLVGSTMAVWAVIYTLLAFASGYWVKPEKSHKVLIGSSCAMALVSLGALVFNGLYTQFLWLILTGACGALFFSPFQMYMKRYIPDGKAGIVHSTALYTGSWSLGFALGPVLFGLLTMKSAYFTCMGLALAMTLGFILLEMFPQRPCTGSVNTLPQKGVDYSRFPDMVWMGYLVGGVGCVVIAFVRTMGPFRGVAALHLSKEEMGLVIAAVSFMQSLTGYLLYFSREWMYRKLPGILLNGCGMAALLCFAFGNNFLFFLIAALLFGIYSGSFFFFFVFHSLVHPTKSARYVAGNETIVGATGVVGPLLGGAFITPASSHWVFIVGALFVLIALVGQQIMLHRAKIN